ncbi:uncharacterized protein EKO05_0006517 [Ascochyta rabiei]|uniref:Uncharacterized protein n=1 Tax=Didymella rabiei TaxID=5454 RepID=A0A162W5Z1_DIDRA|nr:uncharacterized protein EKO05_0006517 [Ascochyta rabiei]KZM18820.1 hypothetical protein ST47_g10122 [Ascochyta rabiei]UPX16094.1 hypothetical protein EKO05_0006517 [Ascochyta rabiei]
MATYAVQGSIEDDIYLGFWNNRSFNRVQGATLTLDRERGGLLIAFLALFVSTSGRSFWKTTRCFLHFICSSREGSDGIQIQRQAILRNTPLPLDAAFEFIGICRAWFRRGDAVLRRTLYLASLALLLAITFIVAGIFSSRVSNGLANETLIIGRECNMDLPGRSYTDDWTNEQYISPFLNRKAAEHLAYALQCYQEQESSQSDSCKVLTVPSLPYVLDNNASCPFAAEMCKMPFGNLMFDTGALDSYKDFGLNKGPPVTLQIKEHCAPLTTSGYTSNYVDPDRSNINFTRYHFGAAFKQNYSFEVAVNATTGRLDTVGDYQVFPVQQLSKSTPYIPQLAAPGAKTLTTLFFLVSSSIMYLNQTQDPWFSATTKLSYPNSTVEWYIPDEPATVLGCVSDRIYCNPRVPSSIGCINLFTSTEDDFRRAWPDARDRLALRPLSVSIQQAGAAGLSPYFQAKSVPTLLSRQTLLPISGSFSRFTTVQTKALPPTQWQKEIEYLGQTTLAAMQHFIVDYARGAWLGGGSSCDKEPCRRSCYSQKVRSSRHYSFSILGVGLILAIGGTFMVAAMLLEPILAGLFKLRWFRRNARLSYAYAEWQAGSTLQLQRLAHESLGLGSWSNATGSVPVTAPGDALAVLDASDRGHPRLVSPSTELAKVDYAEESIGKRPSTGYAKVSSTEQF